MNIQNIKFAIFCAFLGLTFSGCLQTRSDAGAAAQSQVYHKKNADNQTAEKNNSENSQPQKVDDRDETIRTLNGRVESLEAQIEQINKDKVKSANSTENQKMVLLQEALAKMELQLQKLEGEKPSSSPTAKSSDAELMANIKDSKKENKTDSKKSSLKKEIDVPAKKLSAFESAEEFFQKKEWKKAILSFQSHVEEYPKSKSVPEAKYKIGVCFQELGLKDEASAFYEEVIAQYPKTEAGKKSKLRLTGLHSKKANH